MDVFLYDALRYEAGIRAGTVSACPQLSIEPLDARGNSDGESGKGLLSLTVLSKH